MENKKYLEDIRDIRDIMERSSRFISLSGLSGVSAGVIALSGAWAAYRLVYAHPDHSSNIPEGVSGEQTGLILIIATITLFLSILSAVFFTSRKARKDNLKAWNPQSKRLMWNLLIPLATGGIACLVLLFRGYLILLAPLTLVFYGLSLVNASKYTLSEIRSLGMVELTIGLFALWFTGYGLLFWSAGFGIVHIIYGIYMQRKYGS